MRLNGPRMTNALSGPAAWGVRALMGSLRFRAWYEDPAVDPVVGGGRPRLYLFWHEGILLPLHLRGRCHLAMLLSQHRDADVLARIADRFGFACVRGSTYRGGAKALRQLVAKSRTHHLTITPDGPRGPRRQMSQGPVYLASKLGMPVVLVGIGYQRPWRVNSWDRFAIPRPFSRGRVVLSREIDVPAALGRDGIEHWRSDLERRLTALTTQAEAWAASGERRDGEQSVARLVGPAPPPPSRPHPLADAA